MQTRTAPFFSLTATPILLLLCASLFIAADSFALPRSRAQRTGASPSSVANGTSLWGTASSDDDTAQSFKHRTIANSVISSSSVINRSKMGKPSNLKIYVARHGQDLDNQNGILNGHRDQPLTEIGRQQAQTAASKIKDNTSLRFDHIFASPLQRAKSTADVIAAALGMDGAVQVLPDLIERDLGVMSGVPIKEIRERCSPDVLETETICYFLNPAGAETFPDLVQRAKRLLQGLREKFRNDHDATILLVTHGDFGKMLYAAYYDLDWKDVIQQFHFGNSEVVLLSKDSAPEDAHVFKIQQHNS
mmetsp:Transcript_21834/g.60803  ORF Transcript_21834/g.60803 Transcript_21834/m.60803 type:complete len:304 (-) Transcript_21834:1629-2540(-)